MFGLTHAPSPLPRWLKFGKRILLHALQHLQRWLLCMRARTMMPKFLDVTRHSLQLLSGAEEGKQNKQSAM
jgi:hypothetical protein